MEQDEDYRQYLIDMVEKYEPLGESISVFRKKIDEANTIRVLQQIYVDLLRTVNLLSTI